MTLPYYKLRHVNTCGDATVTDTDRRDRPTSDRRRPTRTNFADRSGGRCRLTPAEATQYHLDDIEGDLLVCVGLWVSGTV